MENDKMFNLQLTIQKLEEELNLYRNGTTGSELLAIIAEKDKENDNLMAMVLEKTDKYKRLKATSQEVLGRCDQLQNDCAAYKLKQTEIESQLEASQNSIHSLEDCIHQLEFEKSALMASNAEQAALISQMEQIDHEQNETIDKLHKRMAAVLQDKHDKIKSLEAEKAALLGEVTVSRTGRAEAEKSVESACRLNQELSEEILVLKEDMGLQKQLLSEELQARHDIEKKNAYLAEMSQAQKRQMLELEREVQLVRGNNARLDSKLHETREHMESDVRSTETRFNEVWVLMLFIEVVIQITCYLWSLGHQKTRGQQRSASARERQGQQASAGVQEGDRGFQGGSAAVQEGRGGFARQAGGR
jgi:chromosome segregation ATPase